MKKLILSVLALVVGVSGLFMAIPVNAATLRDYYEGASGRITTGPTLWSAMTFTPSVSYTMTSVDVKLDRWNAATGSIHWGIYATSANLPTGSSLGSVDQAISTITTSDSGEWYNLNLPDTALTGGTKYAIVANCTDVDANFKWHGTTTSGYSGGNQCTSNNSGASWTAVSTYDMTFRVYEGDEYAPTVTTGTVGSITPTAATAFGDLTDLGSATEVACYIQYGTTTDYGSGTSISYLTETGTFSGFMDGLTANTTYHYRAVAVGDGTTGIDYGNDDTFTTTSEQYYSDDPFVMTVAATNYSTGLGFTLNGNLTKMGLGNVTTGFMYHKVGEPWRTTWSLTENDAVGTFLMDFLGASANSWYEFYAIAKNSDGTTMHDGQEYVTGEVMTFFTGELHTPVPFVLTQNEPTYDATTAVLSARATGGDIAANDTISFFFSYSEYALSHDVAKVNTAEISRVGPGQVSGKVINLKPGTKYRVIAYCYNASGDLQASNWCYFTTLTGTGATPGVTPTATPLPGDEDGDGVVGIPEWFKNLLKSNGGWTLMLLMVGIPIFIYWLGYRAGQAKVGGVLAILADVGILVYFIENSLVEVMLIALLVIIAAILSWWLFLRPRSA